MLIDIAIYTQRDNSSSSGSRPFGFIVPLQTILTINNGRSYTNAASVKPRASISQDRACTFFNSIALQVWSSTFFFAEHNDGRPPHAYTDVFKNKRHEILHIFCVYFIVRNFLWKYGFRNLIFSEVVANGNISNEAAKFSFQILNRLSIERKSHFSL